MRILALVLVLAACGNVGDNWRTEYDGDVELRCNEAGWCYQP